MAKLDHVKPADARTVIWRYMNLDRFLSLVKNEMIYFPTVYQFKDPYEGIIPDQGSLLAKFLPKILALPQVDPEAFARLATKNNPNKQFDLSAARERAAQLREVPPKALAKELALVRKWLPDLYSLLQRLIRSAATISCWHANKGQSAAMWDLYCKTGLGIAIRSTVGRVRRALGTASDGMFVAKVEYHSDCPDIMQMIPTVNSLFQKRASFDHEREVRFVELDWSRTDRSLYDELQTNLHNGMARKKTGYEGRAETAIERVKRQGGKRFGATLNDLIERVYIAPMSDKTIKTAVERCLKRKGLGDKRVIMSDLFTDPFAVI